MLSRGALWNLSLRSLAELVEAMHACCFMTYVVVGREASRACISYLLAFAGSTDKCVIGLQPHDGTVT